MVKGQIDFSSSGKYDAGQFLGALAPLSIFVDSKFEVTGASPGMIKAVDNLKSGVDFSEVFQVIRPKGKGGLQKLEDSKYFVQIEELATGRQFKCTKLNATSGGCFMLICNPIINSENGPSAYGLGVGDFPVHDVMAEYVFLLKANKMGMTEANEMLEKRASLLKKMAASKEFYEKILNKIPIDIAVFDKAHKYMFVNEAAIQNKERRDFIIGKDDFDYAKHFNIPIEEAKRRRETFDFIKDTGLEKEWVHEITSKKGEKKSILRRMSPILNERDEMEMAIGYGLDLTKQIEQDKQIESISRFPKENPHPVIRTSINGEISFANEAAKETILKNGLGSGLTIPNQYMQLIEEANESDSPLEKVIVINEKVFSTVIVKVPNRDYFNIYSVDITKSKNIIEKREKELEQARQTLTQLNERLESRYEEVSENLTLAQKKLIEGEKLTILGRLSAGVAHEMNTPLGAIYASSENLTGLLKSLFKIKLKEADHETILRAFNLSEKFSEKGALVSSREERQQVRELSTFIENSEKIGNHGLKYARELVECGITTDDADSLEIIFNLPDYENQIYLLLTILKVRRSLSTITFASQKAASVVKALKSYVHESDDKTGAVFNIKESILSTLILFNNQTKYKIDVHLDLDDDSNILGNESEASKIWSNLIANSIYAIGNEKGNIWIEVKEIKNKLSITFSNDGQTIPEAVRLNIFEPFYTTKPIGEGSGMGLSMVRNVISNLGGTIELLPQEKTTFLIQIPKAIK
ncbi:MAG: signal transduction histidine kinase [Bacteroidia bacterium]|jgi:signal transduction histidine kinase